MLQKEIVYGLVYSEFDQIEGPVTIFSIPNTLNPDLLDYVSQQSMRLEYQKEQIPTSLAIIPMPEFDLKSIVRYIRWGDTKLRGQTGDATLTLLFHEKDDLIFYKYLKQLETIFKKISKDIVTLKEKNATKKELSDYISTFHADVKQLLVELRKEEFAEIDSTTEEFPEAPEGEKRKKFKIIVCGEMEVGKTSIVLRFTDKAFRRTYIPTLGVNISHKLVYYENIEFLFVIWDIAGQSKFLKVRKHFYEGSNAQILVFDLTRPETLHKLHDWYSDVKKHLQTDLKGIILANKNDLKDMRKVSPEEIMRFSDELNLESFETSALTGENINEAFSRIAEMIHEMVKNMD